jgi:hypothetical protein
VCQRILYRHAAIFYRHATILQPSKSDFRKLNLEDLELECSLRHFNFVCTQHFILEKETGLRICSVPQGRRTLVLKLRKADPLSYARRSRTAAGGLALPSPSSPADWFCGRRRCRRPALVRLRFTSSGRERDDENFVVVVVVVVVASSLFLSNTKNPFSSTRKEVL